MAKHVRFEEIYPSRRRSQWLFIGSSLAAVGLFVVGLFIGVFGVRSGVTFSCGDSYASYLPVTATESHTVAPAIFLPEDVVRDKMFAEFKAENIREHLLTLTKESHPAGTPANNRVADYISSFLSSNLGADNVNESSYDVLLSRPNNTNPNIVKIVSADGNDHAVMRNKESQSAYDFDSAIFGFSAQGSVESDRLFYVNTGSDYDYELLLKHGLLDQINGSVVLMRYGGFRGAQVDRAAEHGAKAVLLYLDPSAVAKYGTDESKVFPNGVWMPDTAMERGVLSTYKGDPLSQSFVSELESKTKYRTALKDIHLPKIPAVPIGYGDAQILFDLMDNSTALPSHLWAPSNFMRYSFGGQLPRGRKISVKTTNHNERSVIKNIIGRIRGCQEPDRYVILGNHYDAWTMGGIDPNSGTATLLEVARVMGVLRKRDAWCPRRTIIFASWDAEEYGLIGSTEWVEENMQILQERAVTYINIDAAVRGRVSFYALGVPMLSNVIYSATKLVADPSENSGNKASVYDVWANTTKGLPQVYTLSSGSDYASFVNMIGVPSADLRYNGEVANPSYHTAFETYEYVAQQIDPTFEYHVAVGKVWGEIVRDIADSVIVPFSMTDMAEHMNVSWHQVRQDILAENTSETPYDFSAEIDFDSMSFAIREFEKSGRAFDDDAKAAVSDGRHKSEMLMRQLNDKLIKLDRMFILPEGLPGRPLYRHILYAPAKSNAYGSSSFPGIVDCVANVLQARKKDDQSQELKWSGELRLHSTKVIQTIDRAARFLSPAFSGLNQSL